MSAALGLVPALAGKAAATAGVAAGAAGAAAGGALAAGTAATAGGLFAGGGLQIFGSILGGIGQGMMMKAEMRERERQQIEKEKRAEARYRGLGEAARFWDGDENDTEVSSAAIEAPVVGQGMRVGEQYQIDPPEAQPAPAAAPRSTPMRYDVRTGRLVQS